jgi:hypothetical protein
LQNYFRSHNIGPCTPQAPYIQLEIKENNQSNRSKRNLGKVCNEETDSAETHCCLWPFTVDFEKVSILPISISRVARFFSVQHSKTG